jgi:hypothetical protein
MTYHDVSQQSRGLGNTGRAWGAAVAQSATARQDVCETHHAAMAVGKAGEWLPDFDDAFDLIDDYTARL